MEINEVITEAIDNSNEIISQDDLEHFPGADTAYTEEILYENKEYVTLNHEASIDHHSNENDDKNTHKKLIEIKPGLQHFDILKLIGKGAFGSVYIVKNKINSEYFAMKVISKKLLRKKNNMAYMKSERDILTKVHHPFVVSLHYAFQTGTKLYLVMDFLGGGEFFSHLRRNGVIIESQARIYFAEMILAIEFLHGIGVIHRDLKPENVLLRLNGHVCITDFGLAKEIGDGLTTRTLCGTSEYMAPEMLTRNGYGKAVDWWSLGALFYEVLVGKPPFIAKDPKDLDHKILFEKISLPSFLSNSAHSLLKGMIERDVNKRLGASKSTMFSIGGVAALKQHTFFDGIDWLDILHGRVPAPFHMDEIFSRNQTQKQSNTNPISLAKSSKLSVPLQSETIDLLIMPFHDEFTNQAISMSILEDCYDTIHSTLSTPPMSPPNGTKPMHTDAFDPIAESKEYNGFEYQASGPLYCTEEMYQQFEQELNQRLIKLQKKRNQKLKQEIKKVSTALSSSPMSPLNPVNATNPINITSNGNERSLSEQYRYLEEERQKKYESDQRLRKELETIGNEYNNIREELIRQQEQISFVEQLYDRREKNLKKVKNLRKKLKDIYELEEKYQSVSGICDGMISGRTNTDQKMSITKKSDKIDEKKKQSKKNDGSMNIASTENTVIGGMKLNSEQLEKLSKKNDILQEIESLENELVSIQQPHVLSIHNKTITIQLPIEKSIDDKEKQDFMSMMKQQLETLNQQLNERQIRIDELKNELGMNIGKKQESTGKGLTNKKSTETVSSPTTAQSNQRLPPDNKPLVTSQTKASETLTMNVTLDSLSSSKNEIKPTETSNPQTSSQKQSKISTDNRKDSRGSDKWEEVISPKKNKNKK